VKEGDCLVPKSGGNGGDERDVLQRGGKDNGKAMGEAVCLRNWVNRIFFKGVKGRALAGGRKESPKKTGRHVKTPSGGHVWAEALVFGGEEINGEVRLTIR